MTTDTKTRRKATAEPVTLEQIAKRKMRDRLTAYRELVTRAAAGEQLPEVDLDKAVDLLDSLGLPHYALQRDIQARTEFDAASKAQDEARARRPANDKRLLEIAERLKTLDAELTALKSERHALGVVADNSLAAVMARRHELEAGHPHVLLPLEDAVRFRLEQQQRKRMSSATEPAR